MIHTLFCSLTRYRNAAEAMVAERAFTEPVRAAWCQPCAAFHVRPRKTKKAGRA